MPTFEHTVHVEAPIDHVFAFGIDPENWQRTMPGLKDVEIVEESDHGLRITATYEMLGRSIETEMEFTVIDPNAHTVTRFESPSMTGELHYLYSEADGRTKVDQQCDYEFGDSLLERVLEPVAKRYNKRQFKQSLQTSKDLIEAETRVPAEA